jgi:predicted NUDIX family phosphoesterase
MLITLNDESDLTKEESLLLRRTIELQKLDKQCLQILNDHLDEYENKLRDNLAAEVQDPEIDQVISYSITFTL